MHRSLRRPTQARGRPHVPRPECLDPTAQAGDLTHSLMPWDEREARWGQFPLDEMQVGVAYATCPDAKEDFTRSDVRNGLVLQVQRAGFDRPGVLEQLGAHARPFRAPDEMDRLGRSGLAGDVTLNHPAGDVVVELLGRCLHEVRRRRQQRPR